ncbi:UBP-type zinc finger domain-containing protein [Streptomyces sp. NPDC006270]|uniref:UBP-type zinc finger domain-containing protein n=1 Tax=Streptomyces sp. NPDC006270 TaxID=3364741 RepID=UPI003694BA0C
MSECAHAADLPRPEPVPLGTTRPECLEAGTDPVRLRLCLTCGHGGCCDSPPSRRATGHFRATGHPVTRSFEPGESRRRCFEDGSTV